MAARRRPTAARVSATCRSRTLPGRRRPSPRVVYVAATRNPNQIFELAPVAGARERTDLPSQPPVGRPLLPEPLVICPAACTCTTSRSSAVACTRTPSARTPSCASTATGSRSRLVATGDRAPRSAAQTSPATISAQLDRRRRVHSPAPSSRPPTRQDRPVASRDTANFAVDRRGVIFSGATREPVVRGLTRPHSARLHERRALGRQQRLRRGRHRIATAASSRSLGSPAGLAGCASARPGRVRRHLAGDPALPTLRARSRRRPQRRVRCTRSTCRAERAVAVSTGRGATRSSRSRSCPRVSRSGFPALDRASAPSSRHSATILWFRHSARRMTR